MKPPKMLAATRKHVAELQRARRIGSEAAAAQRTCDHPVVVEGAFQFREESRIDLRCLSCGLCGLLWSTYGTPFEKSSVLHKSAVEALGWDIPPQIGAYISHREDLWWRGAGSGR